MVDRLHAPIRNAVRGILLGGTAGLLSWNPATGAELPMPCIAGSCGPIGPSGWVSSGAATATQQGNTLTINQTTDKTTLNWASFNVSADGRVVFNQPSTSSIALNRIFQSSPSRIFGQIQANGEIYLVNPNGMVFGRTASINAAGILASTLSISDSTFAAGIASPSLLQNGQAALQSDGRLSVLDAAGNPVRGTLDANGNIVLNPAADPLTVQISVQQGAKLATSASNGRLMLAAQNVDNAGSLTANDGQVILAAGDAVYLQASSDPALRGLLVEVGAGGSVWNRLTGDIATPRGNSTLLGYAVNQEGRISATTTVSANGSIRLLARDSAKVQFDANGNPSPIPTRSGTLRLGGQSLTSVTSETADTQTAVDDQQQQASHIELMGHQVTLASGSTVRATGGTLDISAVQSPAVAVDPGSLIVGQQDSTAQLRIENGAVVDLTGSDATLPMSRNLVTVELRSSELRDSPTQRDSAIRGQPLVVDARVGTTLGDISGALGSIAKTVAERTSAGGTARLFSDGDVVVAQGASLDVSGGKINYESGYIQTSQLIGADGKLYDVGTADPSRTYTGVINTNFRSVSDRWGQVTLTPYASVGRLEQGYVEGQSAGTLQFAASTLVLNGRFVGNTTVGPYQRALSKLPSGGSFIVGLPQISAASPGVGFHAPSITFTNTPPAITVAPGAALPAGLGLQLPTDYLANGFTKTRLYSNGSIVLPAAMPLTLQPGSQLLLSGDQISIDSSITNQAGSISLLSQATVGTNGTPTALQSISLASGVVLDVSGRWINDSLLAPGLRSNAPLLQDAGSIAMRLSAGVPDVRFSLGNGVSLRADGGAAVSASGAISGGRGGSISLQTYAAGSLTDTAIKLGSDVLLSGFGVNGAAGGSLTIEVPAIALVQGSTWALAQSLSATNPTSYLQLGSALFSDYGFGKFTLQASRPSSVAANANAIEVFSDTTIHAQVKTRVLATDATQRASGGTTAAFTTVVLPELDQRRSATLSLQAGLSRGDTNKAATLAIDAGALIEADPGSTINLSSMGSLRIDGTVRAPSGVIQASVIEPGVVATTDTGYRAGQQVLVSSTGTLDVAGITIPDRSTTGLQTGRVSAGGTIALSADRGSVVTAKGSQLLASGGAAMLDVPTGDTTTPYVRQWVGGAGGNVSLRARESIQLGASIQAAGGRNDVGTVAGGALTLEINRTAPNFVTASYPAGASVISLTERDNAGPIATGSGFATVSKDYIVKSGFDALTLRAYDSNVAAGGTLLLDPGLDLNLARRISLSAPFIAMNGLGTARLNAAYVSVGEASDSVTQSLSAAGLGSLQISGQNVDLLGNMVFSRIRDLTVASSNDLRLRGTSLTDGTVAGSLNMAGDITLAAARIYATTATHFAVTAAGGANDAISILQKGSNASLPLSAASSLSLTAKTIQQGGTLLAPFGRISLNASDKLSLLDGSVTSVTGNGALIPYGSVLNGTWSYDNGLTATPQLFTALPDRTVELKASSLILATGATVDVRGGGDLYAYEWVPGSGGSTDALAPASRPGLYAVLPQLINQIGPYDPQEFARSGLTAGDSVYLSGYEGLPAGLYPLLPARYALLPNAFLISAVASSRDYVPGQVTAQRDGTPVIAGYSTFGSTGLGSAHLQGYAIRPGSYGRLIAQYNDNYASSYLADKAAVSGSSAGSLPMDAGSLSLFAGQTLDAKGIVKTAAAPGGAGASIDVSALRLAVSATGNDGDSTTTDISAATLASWAPTHLTLGGQRSATDLSVTANDLFIRSGTSLSFADLLITARNSVNIETGAAITTPSGLDAAKAPKYALPATTLSLNDSASSGAVVLAASDSSQILVSRTAVGAVAGQLQFASGASLATRGALTLDAPGGVQWRGNSTLTGAQLALGANQVLFANAPQAGALVIDAALQSTLQTARTLSLSGNQLIGFQRNVQLNLAANTNSVIQLTSPQLVSADGLSITMAADHVGLAGSLIASGDVPVSGTGTLGITATTLDFAGGNLSWSGFANTNLVATDYITTNGVGSYRNAGAISLRAPVLAVNRGADTVIESLSGTLQLQGQASATAKVPALQLGGALSLRGANITDSLAIRAPSGLVTLDATNSLSLQDGAVIDVAGRLITEGNQQAGSQGGDIRLSSGGTLSASSGSQLTVSGAGQSASGSLTVRAGGTADLGSRLVATGAGVGGSFDLKAASLNNFAALTRSLESARFNLLRNIQVASGDLDLAAGDSLTARTVQLGTSSGAVRINGSIDARSADLKGRIVLEGGQGVAVGATAALIADTTGTANSGGDIELATTAGRLDIAATSRISSTGPANKGVLLLRAPVVANDVAVNALPADLGKLAQVQIAPVFVSNVSATPTTTELNNAKAVATNFVNNNGLAVLTRLGAASNSAVSLRPEIQLRRTGDLNLSALDLSSWRYAGLPGTLSIQATGDLRVNGTISDGFVTTGTGTAAKITLGSGESSNLRLSAGNDLLFNTNAVLRTGTGSLLLQAGRDLVFASGSKAYTGGLAGAATQVLSAKSGTVSVSLPDQGGELTVLAGRDIIGSAALQSASSWLYRGTRASATQTMPRLWGVNIPTFAWNLGTLGGGDLTLRAGRDVLDITAGAADSALVDAGNNVQHFGGGSLSATAGRNLGTGQFLVMNGQLQMVASNDVGGTRQSSVDDPLGSVLWLANSTASVAARSNLFIESVINPTVLLVPSAPNSGPRATSFFTYSDTAAVTLQSAAGDVTLRNNRERLDAFIEAEVRNATETPSFAIYPPSLAIRAFSSDIAIEQFGYLYPAATGQLALFAGGDIQSDGTGGLVMSDGYASGFSSILTPAIGASSLVELTKPASAARHLNDLTTATIAAGNDISDIILALPKSVTLVADRDVRDMTLSAQNMRSTDLTLVSAARDITMSANNQNSQFLVGGPGRLDLLAGRDVDLGFSQGAVTTGALLNTNLPAGKGADLTVLAGIGKQPDYTAFATAIIAPSADYKNQVVSYMASLTGNTLLPDAAYAAFQKLDVATRRPLLDRVFFNELVQSGRDANATGKGFARGYAAIDALFPGSRSEKANPFAGNLNMSFSRVYTLDGGDISLLMPGGLLNVGLANPPTSVSQRDPSLLGIVAQGAGSVRVFTRGDVLVNQSRVFTLLGGDIAVWSTSGNIDAGRGAKSSLSAPPPTITIDASGKVTLNFAAAVAGSGIRTIITGEGIMPGSVDLIAPAGFVNAGDAGIGSAGNLNIAAQSVVGLDNIQVGGASVGVPAETGGLGASLAGASSVGAASSSASGSATAAADTKPTTTPVADSLMSFLDVFVEGFGEDNCKPGDAECLSRQK